MSYLMGRFGVYPFITIRRSSIYGRIRHTQCLLLARHGVCLANCLKRIWISITFKLAKLLNSHSEITNFISLKHKNYYTSLKIDQKLHERKLLQPLLLTSKNALNLYSNTIPDHSLYQIRIQISL